MVDKVKLVEQGYLKKTLPTYNIGDTVDVHVRIREGDRERTQIFSGTVIARKGSGINDMVTVRRIVAGEGVERVFPMHSPAVLDIQVTRRGRVRRAKLYYLRDRVGKATKVRELVTGPEDAEQKEKKVKRRGKKARAARGEATEAKAAEGKARAKKGAETPAAV